MWSSAASVAFLSECAVAAFTCIMYCILPACLPVVPYFNERRSGDTRLDIQTASIPADPQSANGCLTRSA